MSSSVAEKLAKKSSRRPASSKQVRLKLVYIDFWSTVKLAFLAGICLAIIAIVGTFLIWTVLDRTGVVYNLLADRWQQSRDMDVNYMVLAEKQA